MEKLDTIKILLDYYDEDGNHSLKEMSVKINKIIDCSDTGLANTVIKRKYSMSFSLVIPNHIHEYLLNKSVPDRSFLGNKNSTITYSDFSKTIKRDTIEGLCDRYWRITQDYKWLKDIEKRNLTKVIFFDFANKSEAFNSYWDGKDYGHQSEISYRHAIGYISDANNSLRFNENKLFVDSNRDAVFYKLKYVLWTQEREDFFNNIQSSFEIIISKINDFESSISETSIDAILSAGLKLLN